MGKIFVINTLGNDATLMELSVFGIVISAIVMLAVPIAVYLLRSIGIYKLAKNHGIDKAFLAWIPFAWVYPLCILVKEFLFFGTPYGKIALPICIIFCVYGGLSAIYDFMVYLPLIRYFFLGGEIYLSSSATAVASVTSEAQSFWLEGTIIYGKNIQYYGSNLVYKLLNKINLIMSLLDLVKVIVLINLYIVLFRKFWPKHYIVAAVMSAFGLFPIFVFVIRNKVAMSFEQYVNSMKTNSSNNTYRETSEPKRSKKDDPFSEFGDDDPFSDF